MQDKDPAEMARRWLPVAGGGVLALIGLRRGGGRGVIMLVAGGVMAVRGLLDQQETATHRGEPARRGERQVSVPHKQGIKVEKVMTIDRPRAELYSFWRELTNLPRFMTHLKSVEVTEPGRSHWVAQGPAGVTIEWDAEIINEIENELIGWRSLENASISNAGSVHFKDAPGGRGTEVHVVLSYDAPGGIIGSGLAKLFGEEPSQQVEDDLRHLKQIMEAGEIPTTDGQPSGSRAKPGLGIGPRIS